MLRNRDSIGLWSYLRLGPEALKPGRGASQTASMSGRGSSRNALLVAMAAAAYFTASPPYAVPPLEPGRPDARRRAAPPPPAAPAADELRDALNAGRPASPRRTPAAESASDLALRLSASALGMTSGPAGGAPTARLPKAHAPSGTERSLPGRTESAAAPAPPAQASGSPRTERAHARPRSGTPGPAASHHAALARGSERAGDLLRTARALRASRPARPAPRRPLRAEGWSGHAAVDLSRSRRRAASLFEPMRRATRRPTNRTRRFRPPRLSQLLGARALKPPPATLRPPVGLAALASKRLYLDARRRLLPPPSRKLGSIEGLAPDKIASDRRQDAHWDGETWHQKRSHGLVREGGWLWLLKDGARWWGVVDKTPLVRHQGLWWLRRSGVWLALHEGEPWVWRHFQDWGAQGFFHPGTGTEIVYSADLARAAVITPGEGAVVYDALTGTEVGRIPEDSMPARRRPKAPESLSLP